MDEEKEQLSAPPRLKYKLIKVMTLTVLFLALFFSIGLIGLKATSSSTFCSSCHEMKPEYYTWKNSSHSEVDCVNCHTEPGVKQTAKDKINLIVKAVSKDSNDSGAPIRVTGEIPDSTCEECHNVYQREFTVTGDIIIPHDKHKEKEVKCTQCHNGVAHGEIADRNMTFKTDYQQWDSKSGKRAMEDLKFTKPDMDTCMECHETRDISTECKTCHTTGVLPKSHKESDFKTGSHGALAKKDIKGCNKCHSYMSEKEIKGLEDIPASQKFLSNNETKTTQISAEDYAKENTFCKDCHTTKPTSHVKGYVNLHGAAAKDSTEKCLACHDKQKTGFNKTNNVTCNSCHPAMHAGKDFKERHPVNIDNATKPTDFCYTCHNKQKCASCHKED
jgi:nitrate/TMAO reductase-like tetraheme cytochrome c subunit